MMWRAPVLLLILLAAARLAGPVPRVERAADQDQDTRRSKLTAFTVVGIIKLLLIGSAGLCCCKISWDIFEQEQDPDVNVDAEQVVE
jgi:hypothetical protein